MAKPIATKKAFPLKPAPTFKAPVKIHVPGESEPGVINFEFKHIKPKDLPEKMEEISKGELTDVQVIQALAVGWDADGPFDTDSITEVVENYANVGIAVITGLGTALHPASVGN